MSIDGGRLLRDGQSSIQAGHLAQANRKVVELSSEQARVGAVSPERGNGGLGDSHRESAQDERVPRNGVLDHGQEGRALNPENTAHDLEVRAKRGGAARADQFIDLSLDLRDGGLFVGGGDAVQVRKEKRALGEQPGVESGGQATQNVSTGVEPLRACPATEVDIPRLS